MGKPGVPSWNDPAGAVHGGRTGSTDLTAEPEWAAAGPVSGSSRAQAVLSRLLAYGLWGGIALALVLGLVNCVGRPAAAPAPAPESTEAATEPAPPGGCAELVVAGWLAGDDELLAGVPGVPQSRPEPGRREAVRTYTAAATQGQDAWAYLIGAEVRVRDEEDRWQPAGTQFFSVTMVRSSSGCEGWRPAALPAQVNGPPLAGDGTTTYPVTLPIDGNELGETLTAFFAGMLAGEEGLERYVTPGVSIAAVVPPPYQQVSVTELRAREELPDSIPPDGTVVQVLATVDTDDAEDLPLVYPMTVGVRGGRWEVIAIDPLVGAAVPDPAEPTTGPAESTNGG